MNLSRAVRIGFGLAAFGAILWWTGVGAFARALASIHPGLLALATVLYGAMFVLKCVRWLTILALQGHRLPLRVAFRGYGLGQVLAAVTPGRVGQHVRALPLVRRGVAFDKAMAGTILDQLADVAFNGSLVPFAVGWFGTSLSGGSLGWGAAAVGLAAVAVALGVRFERRRFAPAIEEALRLGRRAFGRPLLITAASNLIYFASCWALARAVGMDLDPVTVAFAMIASAVVETAPVTVAGLGTREAALIAVLGPTRVEAPVILAFTTVVRITQVVAGGVAWAAGSGEVLAGTAHGPSSSQ